MVLWDITGFVLAFIFLVKSADYSVRSLAKIARAFRVKEFVISFIIIGILSSLPEATVAILSAFKNESVIGFGALLGSNIADLSIILGLVVLIGRRLRITSAFVYHEVLFIVFILLPFILAYDGVLSRLDGLALLLVCIFFMIHLMRQRVHFTEFKNAHRKRGIYRHAAIFLISVLVLVISAYYVVKFTHNLALDYSIPSVILALVIIGFGSCLPEFMFAVRSILHRKDDFALGDLVGNVIVDATLILGITAMISPIILEPGLVLVTGAFTVLLVMMVLSMLRYQKELTWADGVLLVFLYVVFIMTEFTLGKTI